LEIAVLAWNLASSMPSYALGKVSVNLCSTEALTLLHFR
jgi:hypothetical protein